MPLPWQTWRLGGNYQTKTRHLCLCLEPIWTSFRLVSLRCHTAFDRLPSCLSIPSMAGSYADQALGMKAATTLCLHIKCLFFFRMDQNFFASSGLPQKTFGNYFVWVFLVSMVWSFTSFYILTGSRSSSHVLNCQIIKGGERTIFSIDPPFQVSGIQKTLLAWVTPILRIT